MRVRPGPIPGRQRRRAPWAAGSLFVLLLLIGPMGTLAQQAPFAIVTAELPSGAEGTPYTTTLQVTGGTAPYTWSAQSLPTGLSLDSATGVISGTPTQSGNPVVSLTVTDSSTPVQTASAALFLRIARSATPVPTPGGPVTLPAPLGLTFGGEISQPGELDAFAFSARAGSRVTVTVTSLGYQAGEGIRWEVRDRGNERVAERNATIDSSGNRQITNFFAAFTAPTTGIYLLTVETAPANRTLTGSYSLVVGGNSVESVPIHIVTAALPAGVEGEAYAVLLQATGAGPHTWSASGLPSGLTLNGSTGVIQGTLSLAGVFSVTVTVSSSDTPVRRATALFTLTVEGAPLRISTNALPSGTVDQSYFAPLAAAGGTPPYTWSTTTSVPGLSLNSVTGLLSGTPTAGGAFSFTVTVTDSGSPLRTHTSSIPLTIAAPPLALRTTSLPPATAGVPYSFTLEAAGGALPRRWSATGLPAGLLISEAGVISGTTQSLGNFLVRLTVSDSSVPSQSVSEILGLDVVPQSEGTPVPEPTAPPGEGADAEATPRHEAIIPLVSRAGLFQTFISLQNPNGEAGDITLELFDSTGQPAPMAAEAAVQHVVARGNLLLPLDSLLPEDSAFSSGWMRLSSEQEIVGVALLLQSVTFSLAVVPASAGAASTLLRVTEFRARGNFTGQLVITNPSDTPVSVSVRLWGRDGVEATAAPATFNVAGQPQTGSLEGVTLPPLSQFEALTDNLAGSGADAGSITIEASSPLLAGELFFIPDGETGAPLAMVYLPAR